MPRLSSFVLRHAYKESPLLPLLLRSCLDLPSARNELRWLREHVLSKSKTSTRSRFSQFPSLKSLCVDRARGKPLQYILGTQPFGDVEIICKPGVLIPRPETEAYTTYLAQSIVQSDCLGITFDKDRTIHILDLCTGSGCITLLLHALLSPHFSKLKLLGIDASRKAVALAIQNLRSNVRSGRLSHDAGRDVNFIEGNLFAEKALPEGRWDILISNPPYISPSSFDKDTSLSVRRYEPRTALVPLEKFVAPNPFGNAAIDDKAIGDAFYPRLLNSSQPVRAKIIVMEVADMEQAQRVANLALSHIPQAQCEIWRDWPDQVPFQQETLQVQGNPVKVIGRGNGRAVIVRTNFDEINRS